MDHSEERKAGVLVHGTNQRGERCWLMPVVEGRFDFDGEFLVVPKGGIDPGETPLQAGLRELGEETGFWLSRELTVEQFARLERGEDLQNIPLPGYPGASITHFRAKPHAMQYTGRGGDARPLFMFDVEVDGIEHITGLKNSEGKTTKEFLKEHPDHPIFRDFFQWLSKGYIPDEAGKIPLVDPAWFGDLLFTHAPILLHANDLPGRALREVWKSFVTDLELHHRDDYNQLRTAFKKIQTYADDRGFTKGAEGIVRIDINDTPLYRFSEQARWVEETSAMAKMFYDMSRNSDYDRAIGGANDLLGGSDPVHRILSSQLVALVPMAHPASFKTALDTAIATNGGKPLDWTVNPDTRVEVSTVDLAAALSTAQDHYVSQLG